VAQTLYGDVLITPGNFALAGWNVKSLPGRGFRNPALATAVGTSKKLLSGVTNQILHDRRDGFAPVKESSFPRAEYAGRRGLYPIGAHHKLAGTQ
jgi:hypothetical protein